MSEDKKTRKVPAWARAIKWFGIIMAVYAVTGFIALPLWLKPFAVKKLSERLERTVEMDALEIKPFSLSINIEGFRIKTADGAADAVKFDRLYVNAELMSLFKKAVVIREILLVGPYVNLIRRDDNAYNFSYLLPREDPDKVKKKTEPINFSVNNIRVVDGSADLIDNPKGTRHKIRGLDVSVPYISDFGYSTDVFVQPSLNVVINDTPFELKGKMKPFSDTRETEFNLNLTDLDLPYYASYIPVKLGFVVDSGLLDTNLKINYVDYIGKNRRDLRVFGSIALKELGISDIGGGPLVGLSRLDLDITSIRPFSREFHLATLRLQSPRVNLVREPSGELNLVRAFRLETADKPEAEAPAPMYIEVNMVGIDDGRLDFHDGYTGTPFDTVLSPIDLTVLNFNNTPGWTTSVIIEAVSDMDERVRLTSGLTLNPLGAEGILALTGIKLNRYSPYVPPKILAELKTGELDLSAKFVYHADPDSPKMQVEGMDILLEKVLLAKKQGGGRFMAVNEFKVSGLRMDLIKKEAVVEGLNIDGGYLKGVMDEAGLMDLLTLYNADPDRQLGADAGATPGAPEPKPDKAPWVVTVDKLGLHGYEIDFTDQKPTPDVNFKATNLTIDAEDMSTIRGSTGTLAISFGLGGKGGPDKSGIFRAYGTVGINPPSARQKLDVVGLDLARFQPYIPESVGIIVTDGYLGVNGGVSYETTGAGPKRGFGGVISITKFATVDTRNAENVLSWKSLYLKGVEGEYAPLTLKVDEVALTDFNTSLTINEDGSLNVLPRKDKPPEVAAGQPDEAEMEAQPVAEPAPAAASADKPDKPKTKFKADIKAITFQNGKVTFTDRSQKEVFTARLTKMGGRVSGLTSAETGLADVDLRAQYNDFGPIEITGKINPLKDDLYVDLKARFTDVDLTSFTPYTNRYAGYPITKGKLSLNLEYHINKKDLDAKNVLFIDQLTLGNKVDSPDATSLPVKFAIALLRDRKGEIHLDLPVTGRTDDPKFNIWRLAVQVIVNIISKAATAPFALLGAMLGSGEELGYMEYEYGGADIGPPGIEKLDKLAEAMFQRPALKLSIEGHADPERDADALRRARFTRMLKVEKFREVVGDAEDAERGQTVESMEIPPEEYDRYLLAAYEEADFPKPRNFIGMLKEIPGEEMEKLMLTNIKITADDLGGLCSRRAAAVKEALIATGKVGPERIFITEPAEIKPESAEGLSDARAIFTLE